MKQAWLINHYAAPPGTSGGTRHFELARYVHEHGWQMTIIAAGTEHISGQSRLHHWERARLEHHDDIPFLWLSTPEYRGNSSGRIRNMISFFVYATSLAIRKPKVLPRPDIVIGSTVHPLAALAGYIIALRYRVPFVFEIRDLWPETLIQMGVLKRKSLKAQLMYALECLLLSRAKAVIAVLPGIKKYIKNRSKHEDKVVWIPNGATDDHNGVLSQAESCTTSNGDLTFMYFGAFGQANDLKTLITAFHEFEQTTENDKAKLRMIGDGPLRSDLQQYAQSLGIQSVSFEDPLPKEEIPKVAQEADVFLLTVRNLPELYRYGISMNKLFDYMAAGKPTVIANCAINDPIKESGGGISVPSGDTTAMAQAMKELAEMPEEERQKMGKKAKKYVEKHHAFPVLAEKLANSLDAAVR